MMEATTGNLVDPEGGGAHQLRPLLSGYIVAHVSRIEFAEATE
jgi:hypothetical protein